MGNPCCDGLRDEKKTGEMVGTTRFQSLVVWGQLILVRDSKNKIRQELLVS